MKAQTIKALKELCDALIHDGNMPCDAHTNEVIKSADHLKRVLDEEPNSEINLRVDPPDDPICPKCGGRQGYPNSATHHDAPHPCYCPKEVRDKP